MNGPRKIGDGRLDVVRIAGVRRTLVLYDSLERLLASTCPLGPVRRKRGRPHNISEPRVAPNSNQEA